MIGTVIEGRYVGAGVHKLPDRNVLYIQTEDGAKVALSKKNIISIDDVTAEYASYGKKVLMVMWTDFETSIIRLGMSSGAPDAETSPAQRPQTQDYREQQPQKAGPGKKIAIILIAVLLVLAGIGAALIYFLQRPAEKTGTYSVSVNGVTMEGIFSGTWAKGKPNGAGSFTYSDGDVSASYSGQWINGVLQGSGTMEYEGYEIVVCGETYTGTYEGEAIDGVPSGTGTFTSGTGQTAFCYSGQWQDGEVFGEGHLEAQMLTVEYMGVTYTGKYVGDMLDGLPCGEGDFSAKTDEQMLVYSGKWQDGKITGPGDLETNHYTMKRSDGKSRTGTYSGGVHNGIASGEGTFTARNDANELYIYTGEWKDGLWNGQGSQIFPEEESYKYVGTFVDGEFTPTVAEFFRFFGNLPEHEYSISDRAWHILRVYPAMFKTNSPNNYPVQIDNYFQYSAYAKNPEKYGHKLIRVPNLRVVQIFENSYFGYDCTFLIAEDGNRNVYYTYILGHWDNVYEDSRITLTALPMDYFTYPNVSGTAIWAIVCAGVRLD